MWLDVLLFVIGGGLIPPSIKITVLTFLVKNYNEAFLAVDFLRIRVKKLKVILVLLVVALSWNLKVVNCKVKFCFVIRGSQPSDHTSPLPWSKSDLLSCDYSHRA